MFNLQHHQRPFLTLFLPDDENVELKKSQKLPFW